MPQLDEIALPDSVIGDSIRIAEEGLLAADSVGTDGIVEISEMFGNGSRLALDMQAVSQTQSAVGDMATGDVVFGVPALICFLSYCLMLYYFRPQVISLLNILRGDVYLKKLLDDSNFVFNLFLRLAIGFGLLMCAMVVVSYVYTLESGRFESLSGLFSPRWMGLILCLAMWGVAYLVWMFQFSILKVVGRLTPAAKLTQTLIQIRGCFLGLFTIISAPLMMMIILSQQTDGIGLKILYSILLIQLLFASLWMIIRTFTLFMEQKSSISYWFLYLCGVEIFPLSFLVLFALKNA